MKLYLPILLTVALCGCKPDAPAYRDVNDVTNGYVDNGGVATNSMDGNRYTVVQSTDGRYAVKSPLVGINEGLIYSNKEEAQKAVHKLNEFFFDNPPPALPPLTGTWTNVECDTHGVLSNSADLKIYDGSGNVLMTSNQNAAKDWKAVWPLDDFRITNKMILKTNYTANIVAFHNRMVAQGYGTVLGEVSILTNSDWARPWFQPISAITNLSFSSNLKVYNDQDQLWLIVRGSKAGYFSTNCTITTTNRPIVTLSNDTYTVRFE